MPLLNLGPNFVPATKRIPFMDIILAVETCAIDLENSGKETDVEFLRQKVSHILNKNLYIKLRDLFPIRSDTTAIVWFNKSR